MARAVFILCAALAIGSSALATPPPAFPPAAPASSDPATIKLYAEVAAADAGAGRAIYTKNYAALDRYWAPELVVNGPGNRVLSRAEVIEAIASGKLEYHDYHSVVERRPVSASRGKRDASERYILSERTHRATGVRG